MGGGAPSCGSPGGVVTTSDINRKVTDAVRSLDKRTAFSTRHDRDFFVRVYTTPQSVYAARLAAIGFTGAGHVLDAGCGYGQWAVALGGLNHQVTAMDARWERLTTARTMMRDLGVPNVELATGSLDALPFASSRFDAVFCYGAVFFVDFRAAFAEFHRVLRPGGRLYFSANATGWFLHNLVRNHNPSVDFSPRRMAVETLIASARYYALSRPPRGSQLVMPTRTCRSALEDAGFVDLELAAEGQIARDTDAAVTPFYRGRYLGLTGVYEVLCHR
jgi:SAM-dependent methyltransferase